MKRKRLKAKTRANNSKPCYTFSLRLNLRFVVKIVELMLVWPLQLQVRPALEHQLRAKTSLPPGSYPSGSRVVIQPLPIEIRHCNFSSFVYHFATLTSTAPAHVRQLQTTARMI